VIVAARTNERLAENVPAVDVELSPQDLEELDRVSNPGAPYPKWMVLQLDEAEDPRPRLISQLVRQLAAIDQVDTLSSLLSFPGKPIDQPEEHLSRDTVLGAVAPMTDGREGLYGVVGRICCQCWAGKP
jgi:hypothetical protein